ncbi:hypothetical protein [Vibrio sp. Evd11]|uniref:hypothetical protein n=1 Tax=Vibrio sp. Evd11 TaxID=1207404 RepID=UPI0015738054|nr:hypothetical protein [Vibrio sp. Evd11]
MSFKFDASTFLQNGYETSKGEWSDSVLNDLAKIKCHYPELEHWGELALGCAWGDFSQDVYLVSWMHWGLDKRNEDFLSYCYWIQEKGSWNEGLDLDLLSEISIKWKKCDKSIKERLLERQEQDEAAALFEGRIEPAGNISFSTVRDSRKTRY